MKQKGFAPLILVVIIGLIVAGIGIWYFRPGAKQTNKNDFGCWPPSCSLIPNADGKQMCEDWKAGKEVTWPDCKYFSAQPDARY